MAAEITPRFVLWMGGISENTTHEDLVSFFHQHNVTISSSKIPKDSYTGRPLGFAYVIFQSEEDMNSARERANYGELHGKDVMLCPVERDPTLRRAGKGNLYVSGFSADDDFTPARIHSVFAYFGSVYSVRRTKVESKYVPFGYVRFENEEDAEKCLKAATERTDIFGEGESCAHLTVEPYKTRGERAGQNAVVRNLYFRGFPASFSEEKIREEFAKYGDIESFKLVHSEAHNATYGFCSFVSREAAEAAKQELSGKSLEEGSEIYVDWFVPQRRRKQHIFEESRRRRADLEQEREGRNLYIRNLAETVDEAKLTEFFGRYGEIQSVKILRTTEGTHRGIGFVCFVSKDDAQRAQAEARNTPLEEKSIFCQIATPHRDRQRRAQPAPQMGPGFAMGMPPHMMAYPQMMTMQQWNPMMSVPTGQFSYQGYPMMTQMQQPIPAPQSDAERLLSIVDDDERYNAIGNHLYPMVEELLKQLQPEDTTDPVTAEEVTGLLLELDPQEMRGVLHDEEIRRNNIKEAMEACRSFRMQDA